MEILDVTLLSPGMRLAKPVFTTEGKLLFPAGETLSENTLLQLKKRRISQVAIEPSSRKDPKTVSGEAAAPPEDIFDAARGLVAERFRELDLENPYINAVFHLSIERHSRLLLSRPGRQGSSGNPSPSFQTTKPQTVRMEDLVATGQKLGTLPVVFHRLVEIINSPYSSAADAAQIIATDPALSAKLLRLVNSPFYGLAARVDTISRAVVMVGTGQLVMLAMGATLVTAFKGMPVSLIDMQSFWGHSIGCGLAARLIAQSCDLPQSESFFVAGLLHDISRLLIYTQLPTHALYLLTEAKRRQISVHSLEKETLGFTHEELSAELLHSWLCPKELVERVRNHHSVPEQNISAENAVLPVANLLSQALGYGSSGEIFLQLPSDNCWEALWSSPGHLVGICHKLDERIREMRTMLAAS